MRVEYRPIEVWPGKLRGDHQRKSAPFEASWQSTLDLLDLEARALNTKTLTVQLAAPESSFYKDGTGMRADRQAIHPGVIVTLDTRDQGVLVYATDRFTRGYRGPREDWKANVRAIALGLEALRKVTRYGIADTGQQYAGWKALGAGIAVGPVAMTVEEAARLLVDLGEWGGEPGDPVDLITDPKIATAYYRNASKTHHPDAGGDPDMFRRLTEAKDLLLREAS